MFLISEAPQGKQALTENEKMQKMHFKRWSRFVNHYKLRNNEEFKCKNRYFHFFFQFEIFVIKAAKNKDNNKKK